jgi:hypothetical protein
MKRDKKDRSGSTKTTPAIKKVKLPSGARLPKARAPVKGRDIACLVLDLMWSKDKEGDDE